MPALKNKEYGLKLPSLDMSNLGGSKGATASEIASEIVKRLTNHASKVVKKDIIDAELNKLKAKAQKNIDDEKAKLEKKSKSKLEEEKDKIIDKLPNLFGK